MITLTERLDDYIAVRRSLGYDLSFAARVLRGFTRFADREGTDHITVDRSDHAERSCPCVHQPDTAPAMTITPNVTLMLAVAPGRALSTSLRIAHVRA